MRGLLFLSLAELRVVEMMCIFVYCSFVAIMDIAPAIKNLYAGSFGVICAQSFLRLGMNNLQCKWNFTRVY